MKLLSINVGEPIDVEFDGGVVSTGIYKSPVPVDKTVRVNRTNLEGDGQADLTVHGGVDKAVYAYSADTFDWWEKELGRPLETAELGENLTFAALDESRLFVGSTYRLGTVKLQVVQPRFPCFKLAIRVGHPGVLKSFVRSARPGVYFRVLEEGEIKVGQTLTLLTEDPQRVPLITLWDLQMRPKNLTRDILERLAAVRDLNPDWVRKTEKAIERLP